jgi:tetratricopeptide (TPR) repeat protein/O-antigen ligase
VTSSLSTNGSSEVSGPAAGALNADRRLGRRRRSDGRRSGGAAALTTAGVTITAVAIAAAPILAGGVHRATMIALMAAGLGGLLASALGLALQGRVLRVGVVALAPLVFVLVPLVQSIPLPMAARKALDRNGTALLQESATPLGPDGQTPVLQSWPLSLDPPNTRVDVGQASLALVAFLIAYHLTSGQSRRHLVMRAIALAGVTAVVIGLGHRVIGAGKLYGMFNPSRTSLLAGPFVNANHTAEFLELASYVCLACSFLNPTALNRIGWLTGTLLCAAGAAATLSRGAVLALAMSVCIFLFLLRLSDTGESSRRRRVSLAWAALVLGLVVIAAAALGANQLVERFKADAVTTDVRLRLWRDAFHVFVTHPFGIGRGAFDRVFPIYRSFQMPFPLRFAFVECEPLQLLIDYGWFFFLVAMAGIGLVIWWVLRRGRRDRVEAALLTGLFAVLVHSTVDFALETMGVLLPFAAVVGVVLGRARTPVEGSEPRKATWAVVAVASFGLLFGIASAVHGSYDNFDALLRTGKSPAEARALVARAERTHPLDYFYALEDARLAPLRGAPGSPSPRLHALNRALQLCPSCDAVHAEIARNLWRIGLRRQAVFEWRTAVEMQPSRFVPALGELSAAGAKPEELAAVASPSPGRLLELVRFLSDRARIADAFVALDQADALGAPQAESLVLRATLQLHAGDAAAAAKTVERASAAGILDPRLAVLQADLLIQRDGPTAADDALALLDAAAVRSPADTAVQFKRVDLVTRFKKWKAAARAVEGLKTALYQAGAAATDAHIADARIKAEMGRVTASLDEYRIALAGRPSDVALWMEYGRVAETAGHLGTASEAYAEARRLSPNRPDILSAQHGLDQRRDQLRAISEGTLGGRAP